MSDRIEVVGTGTAHARPDLFVVNLGAEATGAGVAAVLETAELAAAAMAETARTTGAVEDADLRTSDMAVSTHHDHQGQPAGYRAWLGLTLTLRDLDTSGTVLAAVLAAGGDAARLQGVGLAMSDSGTALDTARAAAMADARHQAEQLAGLAGRELGGVRRVQPLLGSGGEPRPMMAALAGRQAMALPVEAGTSAVTVSLRVRYDLV